MRMNTTQKDIAKIAKLSQATVSLVLNNKPARICKRTRDKIFKIAEKKDFTINAAARDLARKRTHMIFSIIPDIGNEFVARIIKGTNEIASGKNFDLIICDSEEIAEKEVRHLKWAREMRAEGILVFPTGFNKDYFRTLEKRGFPFVLMHRRIYGLKANFVGFDNVEGGFIMTQHLIKRGYKNIVFVGKRPVISTILERFRGYEKAMREEGYDKYIKYVLVNEWSPEAGYRFGEKFSKQKSKPDAIFAISDKLSVGIYRGLRKKGIRIPDDIALAGHGNYDFAQYMEQRLTTINLSREKIGREACKMLIDLIGNGKSTSSEKIFKPELIIGETT